jgi:6-phosphogluconolactonase (cycloisomerase 2 family)
MVTLTSIAITPASPSIALGTTTQLTATGTYSDSTKKDISSQVTWASATPAVATVPAGLATSVTVGTSVISASLSGVTGNDTLTVTAAAVVSVAITPANPSITLGKPLQFVATGTFTDKTTQNLTGSVVWKSSMPNVAAISNTSGTQGLATASSTNLGKTMIGATLTGNTLMIPPVPLIVTTTVYAYASNFDDGTVSQYVIGTGGALTPLTPAIVTAQTHPFSVSVEPTGQYVYVANWGSNSVSQYTIGAGGALTAVGSGTVATGATPNAVTIDPANRHAYVANYGDNTVSQYTIGLDGALAPLGTPVPTGVNPASVTVRPPNGNYAYVTNYNAGVSGGAPGPGSISQYTVGTDGTLTAMTPATVASGSEPNSVIVDPSGKYAYVANSNDNTVSQYIIGTGGALTPLLPATVAAGARPFSVTVDPSSRYVYVANANDGTISQYTIGAGGGLTPMTPATVNAGAGASSVTIDPTGIYAYVTNRGTTSLSQFTIGTGGGLVAIAPTTVAAGLHPSSIATGY